MRFSAEVERRQHDDAARPILVGSLKQIDSRPVYVQKKILAAVDGFKRDRH